MAGERHPQFQLPHAQAFFAVLNEFISNHGVYPDGTLRIRGYYLTPQGDGRYILFDNDDVDIGGPNALEIMLPRLMERAAISFLQWWAIHAAPAGEAGGGC